MGNEVLENIKKVKEQRPAFKVLKDSAKNIDTSLDSLLRARTEYRRKVKLADTIKMEKAEDLKNFTTFNKEVMTLRAEMDFHIKKIRYAAHTILAETEIF